MFSFSNSSLDKLNTCHPDLIKIMQMAISISKVDFGIAEGKRSPARQNLLYKKGLSRIDGITKKGKHNMDPSEAVDIYAFYEGKAQWDDIHAAYLGGIIETCAAILYMRCEISHLIRWGANWDNDGILVYDHDLKDLPHFELVKP